MTSKGPARACVTPAQPGGGNRESSETGAALASILSRGLVQYLRAHPQVLLTEPCYTAWDKG